MTKTLLTRSLRLNVEFSGILSRIDELQLDLALFTALVAKAESSNNKAGDVLDTLAQLELQTSFEKCTVSFQVRLRNLS